MPTLRKLAAEGLRDGLVCSFPTVTWPNHTTLVTGVTPAKHGVIGNNYLDRETGKTVPLIRTHCSTRTRLLSHRRSTTSLTRPG